MLLFLGSHRKSSVLGAGAGGSRLATPYHQSSLTLLETCPADYSIFLRYELKYELSDDASTVGGVRVAVQNSNRY